MARETLVSMPTNGGLNTGRPTTMSREEIERTHRMCARAILTTLDTCIRRGYVLKQSQKDLLDELGLYELHLITLARRLNSNPQRAQLLFHLRKEDMVCAGCGTGSHESCRNVSQTGELRGPWCDCLHLVHPDILPDDSGVA